jgi:aminomuconate-semialdehyde/2-hydroxymuconate-6-semialdehyde dehydrogenase
VTGEAISRVAAPMFKKLSLELGGKNPNIIFDDANLEEAVAATIRSSFLNQGEICLCGSRIYVQKGIYDQFMKSFVAKAREIKVGDPREAQTFMGPLVSKEHLAKVESFFEIARAEGVEFACGGKRPVFDDPSQTHLKNGYFLEPTILTNVEHRSRLIQEEIFGPVVTVTPFSNEEEVLELANGTKYGLSATVWTQNLGRAHRMAERLNTGTVWINTWMNRDLRVPFGGVKASGIGREGQEHSLEFFTEAKTICVKHS